MRLRKEARDIRFPSDRSKCSNFSFHDSSFFVSCSTNDYFHFLAFSSLESRAFTIFISFLLKSSAQEMKEHLGVFLCVVLPAIHITHDFIIISSSSHIHSVIVWCEKKRKKMNYCDSCGRKQRVSCMYRSRSNTAERKKWMSKARKVKQWNYLRMINAINVNVINIIHESCTTSTYATPLRNHFIPSLCFVDHLKTRRQ